MKTNENMKQGYKLSHKIYGEWYYSSKYQIAKLLKYKNVQNFYQMYNYNMNKGNYKFKLRNWTVEESYIDDVPSKYIDRSLEDIKQWYNEQPDELKKLVKKIVKTLKH